MCMRHVSVDPVWPKKDLSANSTAIVLVLLRQKRRRSCSAPVRAGAFGRARKLGPSRRSRTRNGSGCGICQCHTLSDAMAMRDNVTLLVSPDTGVAAVCRMVHSRRARILTRRSETTSTGRVAFLGRFCILFFTLCHTNFGGFQGTGGAQIEQSRSGGWWPKSPNSCGHGVSAPPGPTCTVAFFERRGVA